MRFKSVEVSRFRQFRSALEVHGLTPGLNVIAGDNEEGKSTLLQAVRAALFDKYTSSAADAYRPYGEKVSPRVRLVFELQGLEFRLDKVFSRRKDGEATLSASDGRRWEGPQAEELVAELLGFSYAARGASRAEHQGLAGLLWVEQAHAYEAVSLSDQSRRQLHSVFDSEMSELLGGEHGEALHRRIEARRRDYFDARNRPRGDYRQLLERKAGLAEDLESARLELQAYEHKTDQLERRQAALQSCLDDRALEKAQAGLREAREKHARVQQLMKQIEGSREKLGRLRAEREAASLAWESRVLLAGDRQQAEEALQVAGELLARREAELEPAQRTLETVKAEFAAEKKRRLAEEARLRRAREAEELARLSTEAQRLRTRLQQARGSETARRRCQTRRDAIAVTFDSLDQLRRLEQARALAEARLHAAATRVDHYLEPAASVRLAGEPLAGEGSVLLTETSVLEAEGVGRFTVHPGGEDLERLAMQLQEHTRSLHERLAELSAADLREAEGALNARQALDREAREHAARLSGLAPDGVAGLEQRLESLDRQRRDLADRLGEASNAADDPDRLQAGLVELGDRIAALEAEVAEGQRVYGERREGVAEAAAGLRSAQTRAQAADEALETARKGTPDAKLAAALADAERGLALGGQQLAALEHALEAENPDAVALGVERCEKAVEQVQAEIRRLETQVRDLSVELNALGQRGIAEELAQAESDHATVERELDRVEAQALAVDLLYRTLDAALKRAKEAVARPVVARLVPYLRQLIPAAEPDINEDLVLTGIRRGRTAEPFEALSIGTREQLAVLVRLAYADLLSERGMPVTVILDDALVNSDDERRERMKAILYQAAKRYQILVLTCHERDYRDAGGTLIHLAECKAGETP
ncbi:MAG: AAA family ATPase [Gammaproteobacteria bacterium]